MIDLSKYAATKVTVEYEPVEVSAVPPPEPTPPVVEPAPPVVEPPGVIIPPTRDGRLHTIEVPRGLLGTKPGETGVLRSIEDMQDGDTVAYEVEEGLHMGGRFEVRPQAKVHIIVRGNNADLDVSRGAVDEENNPTASFSGTEAQGVLVLNPNCLSADIKDLTLRSAGGSGDRCLRVNGQGRVIVDNVVFDAQRHGIHGVCEELFVTNCKFPDAARKGTTGREHAIYVLLNKAIIENNEFSTVNGHAIKITGTENAIRKNTIIEGPGNTGAALNWMGGSGVCLFEGNNVTQNPSVGNRAIFILYGRWIGGGELRLKDNTIIDNDPKSTLAEYLYTQDPPVTVVNLGGNTYNGGSF